MQLVIGKVVARNEQMLKLMLYQPSKGAASKTSPESTFYKPLLVVFNELSQLVSIAPCIYVKKAATAKPTIGKAVAHNEQLVKLHVNDWESELVWKVLASLHYKYNMKAIHNSKD